jgi:deoxyribodipyrimidine photolyase-related protein
MILIIFNNCLFEINKINLQNKYNLILLIEHPIYFTEIQYSIPKLIFQRASMKCYENYLNKKNIKTKYINFNDFSKNIYKQNNIYAIDPLNKQLQHELIDNKVNILEYPNFLLSYKEHFDFYNKNKIVRFTTLYSYIKKKYNFNLISFDFENRNPFPKELIDKLPKTIKSYNNGYIEEAKKYIKKLFNVDINNILIIFPIDSITSKKNFDLFLKNNINDFSSYQDSIIPSDINLYGSLLLNHSGMSVPLNYGLISIEYILQKLFEHFKNKKDHKSLNNFENFFRQLVWREMQLFCFINNDIYNILIKNNYYNCNNKLTKKLYDGTTNIKPLDDAIKLVNFTGYLNHINRLMVVGITFLLLGIKPSEAELWFIQLIDSFQWVMSLNVYSMLYNNENQHKHMIITKCYIHSSNYIIKMSDNLYSKKEGWTEFYDKLYYEFLNKNKTKLKRFGPRMNFILKKK